MHIQVCVDEAGDAAQEEAQRAEACRAEACRETTHLANLIVEAVEGVADGVVAGVVDGQIIKNQKVSAL